MTKRELRQILKEQRDSIPVYKRRELDQAIRELLFSSIAYQSCELIFPYMSFRSEVATQEMIKAALADAKRVCLPRINGAEMEFYEIYGLEELQQSSYGILEPPEDENTLFVKAGLINDRKKAGSAVENVAEEGKCRRRLMLLPGLAFDKRGNRIGYGAGYYDRYLSGCAGSFYKLALAYDFQVVGKIEADANDVKVDGILTPSGLIHCGE